MRDSDANDLFTTLGQAVVGPLAMLVVSLFGAVWFYVKGDPFGTAIFGLGALAAAFILFMLIEPAPRRRNPNRDA